MKFYQRHKSMKVVISWTLVKSCRQIWARRNMRWVWNRSFQIPINKAVISKLNKNRIITRFHRICTGVIKTKLGASLPNFRLCQEIQTFRIAWPTTYAKVRTPPVNCRSRISSNMKALCRFSNKLKIMIITMKSCWCLNKSRSCRIDKEKILTYKSKNW